VDKLGVIAGLMGRDDEAKKMAALVNQHMAIKRHG